MTRRDFLGTTLLASGAALLDGLTPAQLLAQQQDDFTGYGGVGEYSTSNGNTWAVLQAGHKIRDAVYDRLPKDVIETGETYDCVGGGGGAGARRAGAKGDGRVGAVSQPARQGPQRPRGAL